MDPAEPRCAPGEALRFVRCFVFRPACGRRATLRSEGRPQRMYLTCHVVYPISTLSNVDVVGTERRLRIPDLTCFSFPGGRRTTHFRAGIRVLCTALRYPVAYPFRVGRPRRSAENQGANCLSPDSFTVIEVDAQVPGCWSNFAHPGFFDVAHSLRVGGKVGFFGFFWFLQVPCRDFFVALFTWSVTRHSPFPKR